MKKVLLAVVALSLLASCINVHYSSSETHAEESRQLKDFERIALLGPLDVKYAQADTFSVIVQASPEMLSYVETSVAGSVLRINMKDDKSIVNLFGSDDDDVTVYVTSPDFLGIELKGSGDFECQGLLDTDTLGILLQGSGDIEFKDIICDQVHVKLIGSGDIDVKNVKTVGSDVELVGSGDIEMHFTESGRVKASLVGSGDIRFSGAVNDLKSNVRGSGDMDYQRLNIRTK